VVFKRVAEETGLNSEGGTVLFSAKELGTTFIDPERVLTLSEFKQRLIEKNSRLKELRRFSWKSFKARVRDEHKLLHNDVVNSLSVGWRAEREGAKRVVCSFDGYYSPLGKRDKVIYTSPRDNA